MERWSELFSGGRKTSILLMVDMSVSGVWNGNWQKAQKQSDIDIALLVLRGVLASAVQLRIAIPVRA